MSKGNPLNLLQSGSLSIFKADLKTLQTDIVEENNRCSGLQQATTISGKMI